MTFDFDAIIERRSTDAFRWTLYDPDVIPLWVADMDFRSPEPVLRALHERVDHGIFGYQFDSPRMRETLVERMGRLYGWEITPPVIHFLPNLVSALNFVCLSFAGPGEGILMQTPVYNPFLDAPKHAGREAVTADLELTRQGTRLRYEIDFDRLEAAITPATRVFLICSPHNPVGRAWTRAELERLAEIALRHDLIICSDEIHCDLLLDGRPHIPIASLGPEVADRCITLMAPSKTFNLPTLGFGFAIASNPEVMKRFEKASEGFLAHPGALAFTAAQAAYREGQPWLDALLDYLKGNLAFLLDFADQHLPGVALTAPEATYLAWMDWRARGLPGKPAGFLLEKARVGLVEGSVYGAAGEGFTRLNFGVPRALLAEALERIRRAVAAA